MIYSFDLLLGFTNFHVISRDDVVVSYITTTVVNPFASTTSTDLLVAPDE
jgi:hypothetical protein